jgi:hypothetical protein
VRCGDPNNERPEIRDVNDPGLGWTVLRCFRAPFLGCTQREREKIETLVRSASLSDLPTDVLDYRVHAGAT